MVSLLPDSGIVYDAAVQHQIGGMEGEFRMRIAKLDESLEHKLLAAAIYSLDGKKLISEGTILSSTIISGLTRRGIQTVYIEDENSDVKLRVTLDNVKRAKMKA